MSQIELFHLTEHLLQNVRLRSCRSRESRECRIRVDSRQLAKSFISFWCMTGCGRQLPFPSFTRRLRVQQFWTACLY
jgi:hypothetical protein